MASTGSATLDGGKDITAFSQITLTSVAAYRSAIDLAASAAGVSELSIAAPIAREINKTEAGDYDPFGMGAFLGALKNSIAIFGSDDTTAPKLTQAQYDANLEYVRSNNIQNTLGAGFGGYLARLENPVLNDLGIAKIQLGTAMEAVQYYNSHPESHSGSDPLNLSQYIGNTAKLAADLIDPATTMQVSINLQAVIARQAVDWATRPFASSDTAPVPNWSQLSESDKAAFVTAFSTVGEKKFDAWIEMMGPRSCSLEKSRLCARPD